MKPSYKNSMLFTMNLAQLLNGSFQLLRTYPSKIFCRFSGLIPNAENNIAFQLRESSLKSSTARLRKLIRINPIRINLRSAISAALTRSNMMLFSAFGINKTFFFLSILYLSFINSAFADSEGDSCPSPSIYDRPQTWKSKVRIRTLKNLDQFLNWSFSEKYKTYALTAPIEEKKIEMDIFEMRSFVENYGYFSFKHPIVGVVTTNKEDLALINCLLRALYEKSENSDYLQIAVAEVVTKALAYHDLKIGQSITIPIEVDGKMSLEQFHVDCIFNIWHGMPAFGLVPERRRVDSILIFRGTDFSLDSERGWASLMSDIDIAGPGFSAFQRSQKKINQWLR